jgi:hypothetical protein
MFVLVPVLLHFTLFSPDLLISLNPGNDFWVPKEWTHSRTSNFNEYVEGQFRTSTQVCTKQTCEMVNF